MKRIGALLPILFVGLIAIGCAGGDDAARSQTTRPGDASFDRPVPHIGRGPGYELLPAGRDAARARPVDGLRCEPKGDAGRFGAHLEVFAKGLDVVVPAGIGIAPPRSRDGAYVTGGRCEYPVRTREPTGLIEIDSGTRAALGQFFDLWGQLLGRDRLLGFRAGRGKSVSAFVNGRRWTADPRAIPLDRHAAIVVEIGGYFPPTRRYLFPKGL